MLQFTVKQTPMGFGIDEGTDPKAVPFGTLTTCENYSWVKSGRLQKRPGTTVLSDAVTGGGGIPAFKRLFVRGSELAGTDGVGFYSYSAYNNTWTNTGPIAGVGVTWSTLIDQMTGVQVSDAAVTSDNRLVHAWIPGDPTVATGTNGVFWQVIDRASGARTGPVKNIATTDTLYLRVVVDAYANYAVIWIDGTSIWISVNGGTATQVLSTLVEADEIFDAIVMDNGLITIAYIHASSLVPEVASFTMTNPPLASHSSVGLSPGHTCYTIAIAGSAASGCLYLFTTDSTDGLIGYVLDPTVFTTKVAKFVIEYPIVDGGFFTLGACLLDATHCVISYSQSYDNSFLHTGIQSLVVTSAGAVVTAARSTAGGMCAVSKPFMFAGGCYMLAGEGTFNGLPFGGIGQNLYLIKVTTTPVTFGGQSEAPSLLVGKTELLIGGSFGTTYLCSGTVTASGTEAVACFPFQATARTSGPLLQGINLLSITSAAALPQDMFRSAVVDQELMIASGIMQTYDGRWCNDYGFHNATPFDQGLTVIDGPGLPAANSTFLYAVYMEYRSATGMLYRGPTNPTFAINTATNVSGSKVQVAVLPPQLSPKNFPNSMQPNVSYPEAVVFRSVANGSIPYRLSAEPTYNTIYCPSNSYVTSGVNSVMIDNRADTNIGAGQALAVQAPLYTVGGELDDYAPPSVTTLVYHRNRIWALAGDGYTWWFSKDYSSNVGTAPGFHPTFVVVFNEQQICALTLDQRLIFYGYRSIYYLDGDGPAPDGSNSDYAEPSRVQSDVGCINPRSLVATPDGHMFLTERGICMLDRGLEISWIGKPVQSRLQAYPNITSAVLVPNRNEVRFSCNDASNETGIVLVFNYQEKKWSVFKYLVAPGTVGCAITDAILWNGAYTFATTGAIVFTESMTSNLDYSGSYWVQGEIETAWMYAEGPVSYQSVRNFIIDGVAASNHSLQVYVGFNGASSYAQGPATFEVVGTAATPSPPEETWRVSIGPNRKCRSIRFKVVDSELDDTVYPTITFPPGTGQGMIIDTIGIEVGTKKGVGKLPAVQAG